MLSRQNLQTAGLCGRHTVCEEPHKLSHLRHADATLTQTIGSICNLSAKPSTRPPETKTARRTQLPGLDVLRICRDRHSVRVSRRRISQVRPLRNSSQTDAQLKRGISAPRTKSPPLAPELGANPLTCRTPTSITGGSVHAPSQTQKPAEGPLLRPSLALNLDPASVHQLTHLLSTSLPQGAHLVTHQDPVHSSVTPNTPSPHLQLIQPD